MVCASAPWPHRPVSLQICASCSRINRVPVRKERRALLHVAIDPKDTALLVIDIQNGFCHAEGGMPKAGVDNTRQQAVVPHIVELVRLCRSAGLPILLSQQIHYPEDATR